MKLILLDSHPLSLLCDSPRRPETVRCQQWRDEMLEAGHLILIPEIIDYEVRRELIRANRVTSVGRLDQMQRVLMYLPLNTAVMNRSAELWAYARQTGQQTAGDDTIDIDMILVAQAATLEFPESVIATSNVSHLASFHPSELWTNIPA